LLSPVLLWLTVSGEVLVIDTGISDYYSGHLGSLLIENKQLSTIQQGQVIVIPTNSDELISYYEKVLELESDSTNLKTIVDTLKNSSQVLKPAIEPGN